MNDLDIARRYIRKAENAKLKGVEFKLSLTSFKNMMRAQKCAYTGIQMTTGKRGDMKLKASDRTIDRIDCKKGYVPGNVVACCHAANNLKSMFENGNTFLTTKQARKILDALDRV